MMRKVLKFGGTSVGSAGQMKKVSRILVDQQATLVVLSAMSGTTDALVRIAGSDASSATLVGELETKYRQSAETLLGEKKQEALDKIETVFREIRYLCAGTIDAQAAGHLLAQGEILTSALFAYHLEEMGLSVRLLYAPDFMRQLPDGRIDTDYITSYLDQVMASSPPLTFFVTQGFICSGPAGELTNLGRGGSDYSAALIGTAIDATEVQIWTDIDGMHNNDPRFVEGTYPIRQMNFDEAAELAYFGAKILHPATIQPCKEAGIGVRLKNTMDPEAPGTLIAPCADSDSDFRAVAAKHGITVIRIHSTRMLMAYGFLRKVFEVFETYRTSIDMITTSEVAVSLTIDDDSRLPEILRELEQLGTIDVEKGGSIVCVVGNIGQQKSGVAARILEACKEIPVKMISYGASHRSLALLVETTYKTEILRQLNRALFEQ